MYALKPVFSLPADLQITCPVYKLKSLHGPPTAADQTAFHGADQNLNDFERLSDGDIEVLLKKQNEVLNVLEQLELRLNKLIVPSHDLKVNEPKSEKLSIVSTLYNTVSELCENKSTSKVNVDIANLINEDTVVFANPDEPPYSLLALPVLWPSVSWDISYHVHSTIKKDLNALETIKLFKNVSSKDIRRTFKIFVIWQHINPSPKIMRSPTDVLIGEASLLWSIDKFLALTTRISSEQTISDSVMTLINEIGFSKNDRTSELYDIINDSTKILDVKNVAVWSLLYKKKNNPQRIEKWIEQLTKMIVN